MDFLENTEKFFWDDKSRRKYNQVVEEAKKYDIYNLIARLSALNLFHENQTKSIIFDTYIDELLHQSGDQFKSKYIISPGKFRRIINEISNTNLKYSVDPQENMFVQNIMFYGNYRVLNGIDQTPAYNLQNMISAIFAKDIEYPEKFLNETYILVNGMLTISETIINGISDIKNQHHIDEETIFIPSSNNLNKYAEYLVIEGQYFRELLRNNNDLLELIIVEFGVEFESMFNNKSFFTRPFLYNKNKDQYILLNISLLPTAIVFWIACLAKKHSILEMVFENYNDYVFRNCKKYLHCLGHEKVIESKLGIKLFCCSGYKEFIVSVQNNQLMLVQYLYDDCKNYDMYTLHSSLETKKFDELVPKRLSYHFSKLTNYGIKKENIFVVIIINSLGRGIPYDLGKYDYYYLPLLINPFELMCISINESAERVFIPRYLKAKSNLQIFDSGIFSELDKIELYYKNNYSFYMSDEFALDEATVYFAPGNSIDYIIRAIQKENRKLVENCYGDQFIEVILHDSKRGIYIAPDCSINKEIRYFIEFETFNIWIVSKDISNKKKLEICFLLVDMISYWLSECRTILDRIDGCMQTLEVQVILTEEVDNNYNENFQSFNEAIKIKNIFPVMKIFISPDGFQYFNFHNNSREKEFIAYIISNIYKLIEKNNKFDFNFKSIFDNPIQKKIYSLEYQKYYSLEPIQDRRNHFIHNEDEDILLNEIGEDLVKTGKWRIGIIENSQRTAIAHAVVTILYKKLQQEVAVLSSVNLIEAIYEDLEKILFNIIISQKKYASDIACYPEKEKEIFEQTNINNKTSIALKFLIEYVAAMPPKGNVTMGENIYERLLAICFLIIDWSYKNDLFYYQIFNTPIEILNSHRIGMQQHEFQHMFSVNEAIQKEQLIASYDCGNMPKQFESNGFLEDINNAFIKEYGYSINQLMLFVDGLRKYSENQSSDTVYVASIETIIEFLSKYDKSLNEDIVMTILKSISLSQRDDYLEPPQPFKKEDIYPWRFNRELSFIRRPIILRKNEIIWGNRQLEYMINFTFGLIYNGKLKAHSSEMKSLVGKISDERGFEFNNFIYNFLRNFDEFEVYANISKVNGIHISQDNKTLGDIDVLIIDREYNKIIAAEVKKFNFSKNPYEMHMEYKKMFEDTDKKKGYYTKHCRRVDWCKKHINDFKKQYRLDGEEWEALGLFIISQPLVCIEIYNKNINLITQKELSVSSIRQIY